MKPILQEVINNIPEYKHFLTIDELDRKSYYLAYKYPEVVQVTIPGYSRNNHPILELTIGEGPKHALLYGSPHPNEPIGTLMLDYLSEALASNKELRDELNYTFHIIKSVDPDGTKLNEGWFKKELNVTNYARNFYRPEADAQVDWTFPIDYKDLSFSKSIPETKVLMDIIDEFKPEFIYPLHNAGFGGTYWYLSEPVEEKYEALYKCSKEVNIPIHLGEPEMPFIKKFAPAIFKMVGTKQIYDHLDKYTPAGVSPADNITNGTCSFEYAENTYKPFSLMTELPYFLDERVGNLTETEFTRRENLLEGYKYQKETLDFIRKNLTMFEKYIDKNNNPFYNPIFMYINGLENNEINKVMINQNKEYEAKAKVAETFDTLIKSKFYMGILAIGILYRASLYELDRIMDIKSFKERIDILKKANKKAFKRLNKIARELESELDYRVVPIKDTVKVQLETGLIFLDYLNK